MDFPSLMYRSGLPADWHQSAFSRGLLKHSILELYKDSVKECCFRNRPDVLRDIASYVKIHKRGDTIHFMGVQISLINNFPSEIVLRLVGDLFQRGTLSLLPSFVQTVVDVSACELDALTKFTQFEVTLLNSDDEQLVTSGQEALLEIVQILLNCVDKQIANFPDGLRYMTSQDASTALRFLFRADKWTIRNVRSVESVEKHFRFIVRLVELFMKHRVSGDSGYTFNILCIAMKNIEVYDTMIAHTPEYSTDGILHEKMNAIMDGLADVLRCFLLNRSQVSSMSLNVDKFFYHREYTMKSVLVTIIAYSSRTGSSRKLSQLLFDAFIYGEINKLKENLGSEVQNTPATSENNFHSSEIRALECLNDVVLPRRLQYLARRAIHWALWERKLHHSSLASLGLPERLLSYCLYY